ncbi:MAG: methionine--tRNA ligase [Caldilineaceae bacterium]|nr:methionine--tRNA ligase [Caldilineaceae bacterium]
MNTTTTQQHEPIQASTWYITTSIPYVNAQPHIGHALELIQADTLARYYRLTGATVRLQSGTDENALKNVQAAERAGVATAALVEQNAQQFYALQGRLGLALDDFIRTSVDERHRFGVEKLWRACAANGDIYKQPYRGLYCVGCELFYTEEELVDGCCPVHATVPDIVEEENYFFRLSRYGDRLHALIERDQLRIVPESRKNEVLSFIRRGLHDFSISRSQLRAKGWGIRVPDDPSGVIYVWFDALVNYITGPGYATNAAEYQRFWAGAGERLHVIGKDITRFHAIYWPAMLLSAGLPLPTTILVHGFITINGDKISKSKGNVIDPVALVEAYGTDALRYYLLRKVPTTGDANFTLDEFVLTYNADLADQLGNLVQRVVKMVERYCGRQVPTPGALNALDQALVATAVATQEVVDIAMAEFALHRAIEAVRELVVAANKYVVDVAPWTVAKGAAQGSADAQTTLDTTLYVLLETVRLIGHYLAPFLPDTATAIAKQLGLGEAEANQPWASALRWGQLASGAALPPAQPLFPKLPA